VPWLFALLLLLAQTPVAGPPPTGLLPEAALLGPGWVRLSDDRWTGLNANTVERAAFGSSGGPAGARVDLLVIVPAAGAEDRATALARIVFEDALAGIEPLPVPPPEPPAACGRGEAATGTEGVTRGVGWVVGVALCQGDGAVVVARISGTVGDRPAAEAALWVATLALPPTEGRRT